MSVEHYNSEPLILIVEDEAEIAEIIELPEGTVKSRIFYATKKITQALNEFTPEQAGRHFKLS
jgi:hypothetical protein